MRFKMTLVMDDGEQISMGCYNSRAEAQEYARQTIVRWCAEGGDAPGWRSVAPAAEVLHEWERCGEIFVITEGIMVEASITVTHLRDGIVRDRVFIMSDADCAAVLSKARNRFCATRGSFSVNVFDPESGYSWTYDTRPGVVIRRQG